MLRRVVAGTLILLGASGINVATGQILRTRQLLGASGKCDNKSGYFFEGNKEKGCDWAAEDAKKRCRKRDKKRNFRKVKVFCPSVCKKTCKCDNEPGYFFEGNEEQGCDWVAEDAKKRCKKKDKQRSKKKLKVFCPIVCNKSCATNSPTKPPTQSPSPSQSPSENACDCSDDGNGPIAKVPASGTDGEFRAIVDNYLDGDTGADSSRVKYGNKIGCWDVASVTNMYLAFYEKATFDEPIGCWNTESVTNMYGMFAVATAFNQYIGAWDVASVTNMDSMFNGATAFNQDIGEWVVSLVTNMSIMFRFASAFNQDISEWVVSSVTDMNGMFYFADAFNQNLCSWDIQADATTSLMFSDSKCPNEDVPSASAVCQSCDRRRLAATTIAIDAAGKPNKSANNNDNENKKQLRTTTLANL